MGNTQRYEFDLVGAELDWISAKLEDSLHNSVEDGAKDGWRLFRSFTPRTAGRGEAACLQLLCDRSVVKCLP